MILDSLQVQVTSGLIAASRQWRRLCHLTLFEFGVSEACAGPLLTIARFGDGVRQVDVAQRCGLESSSIVRLIDQLCDANLVSRDRDPGDRRASSLRLTARGRSVADLIEAELLRLRRTTFRHIELSDLKATMRVLDAIGQMNPECQVPNG
ncbi:MarR family transcriptional regulator [Pseudomonas lutea]|uniref:MarR family transcriptional regulator n=1 Tax=Pseudomonas lutea TaxID=243924 RepID=A0ABR9AA68_9PSED|nr:MarR family transcriptional regulator [Pseudomonas lutea]MBD8122921.1 MarR family transcriptional regulator [Pseudomonas lutea]